MRTMCQTLLDTVPDTEGIEDVDHPFVISHTNLHATVQDTYTRTHTGTYVHIHNRINA